MPSRHALGFEDRARLEGGDVTNQNASARCGERHGANQLRFIPGAAAPRLGQGCADGAGEQQRHQQLGVALQREHKQSAEQRRAIGGGKQGGCTDGRQLGVVASVHEPMPVRAMSSTSAIERIWSMVSRSWWALCSSTRRSMRAGLPGLVRTRASLTLMR